MAWRLVAISVGCRPCGKDKATVRMIVQQDPNGPYALESQAQEMARHINKECSCVSPKNGAPCSLKE
jgi:hypothetical protein